MPQLDKFAYFSQIIWLTLILVSLYTFLIAWVLPQVARILKFRSKYVTSLIGEDNYTSGSKSYLESYKALVKKSVDLALTLNSVFAKEVLKFKELNQFKVNTSKDFLSLHEEIKTSLKNIQVRKLLLKN